MADTGLIKIVSGGQTGVDRAALDAGIASGCAVGGWCPRGRLAEDGTVPLRYPLLETPADLYPERTEWNVRDSDATLIVTPGEPTGGTALTVELARRLGRPWLVVSPNDEPAAALAWLAANRVRRLNVAGPRESTVPGIGARARGCLDRLLAGVTASVPSRLRERLVKLAAADLYPVTCEELSAGRSDLEVLRGVIAGGARIVQLRDKQATRRELFAKAQRFRELTAEAGVLLIVNDYLDIALSVGADGVHLGQDDYPVAAARELMPEGIIGASTHSLAEAREAQAAGATYVNIGPIYATQTKGGLPSFVGPALIREVSPQLWVPFTVMGGIKAHHVPELLVAGARKIAVVTAVTQAPDVAAAVRGLREAINQPSLPG